MHGDIEVRPPGYFFLSPDLSTTPHLKISILEPPNGSSVHPHMKFIDTVFMIRTAVLSKPIQRLVVLAVWLLGEFTN